MKNSAVAIWKKNHNERYQLVDHRTRKGYYLPFMKIGDVKTLICQDCQLAELGINIDIFPIDKIPQNNFLAIQLYWLKYMLRRINDYCMCCSQQRVFWKVAAIGFIRCSMYFFRSYICIVLDFLFKNTGILSCSAAANLFFWKYKQKRVPISVFYEIDEIQFEDRRYNAIKDFDAYLSSIYGQYMIPPSDKEKKLWRHFVAHPKWK